MNDLAWLCMTFHDFAWLCMAFHDSARLGMTPVVRLCMAAMHAFSWLLVIWHKFKWNCLNLHDFDVSEWFLRVFQWPIRLCLHDFTWITRLCKTLNNFYDFARIYLTLSDFIWVSMTILLFERPCMTLRDFLCGFEWLYTNFLDNFPIYMNSILWELRLL